MKVTPLFSESPCFMNVRVGKCGEFLYISTKKFDTVYVGKWV